MRCKNDDCEKREKREEGARRPGRMITDGQETRGASLSWSGAFVVCYVGQPIRKKEHPFNYYYEIGKRDAREGQREKI